MFLKGGENMRKVSLIILAVLLSFSVSVYADQIDEFHKMILYPTVRVRAGNSIGSGTIIASIKNGTRFDTFVLTNHHVIEDAIQIAEEWNPIKKKMEKKETRATIEVEQFKYQNLSLNTGTLLVLSDIVEWDKNHDLGLIRMRSDEYFQPAKLLPKDKIDKLRIFEPVIISGCGAGRSPFPTSGMIASLQDEIENLPYWMVTAPSVFGNSGGGTFLSNSFDFVGIPSRGSVVFVGWAPNAVYHMSYIIPISRIYKWLEETGWSSLNDSKAESHDKWLERKKKEVRDEKGIDNN